MQDDSPSITRQTDLLDPARASSMQATLGRSTQITAGDPLPPFFHQLYFWEARVPDELGRDGHPKTGIGIIPDMGLPRRMWAGGRLEFHAPLIAGKQARKTTTIESATRKQGRTGPLAFVTLRHEITQGNTGCVTEFQDLVYREDPDPNAPKPIPPEAPTDEDSARETTFDVTTLFRYSALTFNGHRIHYDVPYAREVEGYSNLVIHGPLLAQLLMLVAEEELGPLKRFSFRATSPLTLPDPATLCRKGAKLWVRAPDGRQCMQAEAEV